MAVFTNLYNKKKDLTVGDFTNNEANGDDVTLSENYTIASCWQLKMFAFCVDQVLR